MPAALQSAAQLWTIARAVRSFLEPVWEEWHAETVPRPLVLSTATCGRSSLFLQKVMRQDFGLEAARQTGAPRDALDSSGFFTGERWQGHSWVVFGPWLIDITADQFNAPPIMIVSRFDYRYAAAEADSALPEFRARRVQMVEQLWPRWLDAQPRSVALAGMVPKKETGHKGRLQLPVNPKD